MGQRMVTSVGQWNLSPEEKTMPYKLSMGEICMAGAISSIPTSAIMIPSERVKCLLQVQASEGGKAKYSGMMDCTKAVLKEGGLSSLYKGTFATLARDVPGAVAYFGTYEILKKKVRRYFFYVAPLRILSTHGDLFSFSFV